MSVVLHILLSFIASIEFSHIYNAPRKLFLQAGITGACGYTTFYLLSTFLNIDTIYASLCGSLVLGLVSHFMAKLKKAPVVLFMIPGIIPLVPGGLAFEATRELVTLDFHVSLNNFIRAVLIAGAIALGLLISDQLAKSIKSNAFFKSLYRRMVYNSNHRT
ncbi:threonine/serine exporter family protein [Staphylococcus massiliensis]|uniref:Threonine/Serine exporter ThrE domain-containing protein n=1 Tax=Staphylococcus massiliensis S46 TaxID=1229783 RepID=K9AQC6_9STAP|nr:threonine/serine exporter family protein [Staphylococcus massiliensis]EKU48226.1 hypothetical protein C273_05952 [Staphylococcus massiliensis S46]MCG3399512.1 threonine/serine exporter family protein [Staphylococcus massiliensis]MCG3402021.1 threonine/serine exporter family protein [Staphylococcus massiliensis]MCG3412750.1 threonine/serine exporter family protein [Staphylococcus massiliensis]POA00121.1 threonine/serine exporter [Staphylococcus massiliensis CCUG 55927]